MDIGASGRIHEKWAPIAKYSKCIAFDADDRDFQFEKQENSGFRELVMYNCIVSDQVSEEAPFYLTKSPHCSSLLEPDLESLKNWAYASLFEVERIAKLKTTDLPTVLKNLNVTQIDWFKTDSQGIDLRLFKSLGETVISKVIAAEFEPGIINAYKGEDKLHSILAFMDASDQFWLSDFIVKGSQKISEKRLNQIIPKKKTQKLLLATGKISPGWGELTFLNNFKNPDLSRREVYLGWIFSSILNQHGFASELALTGKEKFGEPLFDQLIRYSESKLKGQLFNFKYVPLAYRKIKRMVTR